MPRPPLTVTFITLNEEKNLPRALASVRWADEIVVIDSGSTDRTAEIARGAGAKVVVRHWPGYGAQKNFAQDQATHHWVLNLDADEAVPEALREKIESALIQVSSVQTEIRAFSFPRKTYYGNRWIQHGGWYPNILTRLGDRRFVRWSEPHVHEELTVKGKTQLIDEPLDHYAFTGVADQVRTNLCFARLGAQDLKRKGVRPSFFLILLKPVGKFIESYFLKAGILDGREGFTIAVNAAHSMFLKYVFLAEGPEKPE